LAPGARSPISQLFAAALDGDARATRVLRVLADDDTTASDADALHADRALRALDRSGLNLAAGWAAAEEQRRVWATGYVDQLLARYRDEVKAGGDRPVVAPAPIEPHDEAWMGRVNEWPPAVTGTPKPPEPSTPGWPNVAPPTGKPRSRRCKPSTTSDIDRLGPLRGPTGFRRVRGLRPETRTSRRGTGLTTGVAGVAGSVDGDGTIPPGNATAKAFNAGFQRIAQRARPLPVEVSERVTG
jgi:hypothetical protein